MQSFDIVIIGNDIIGLALACGLHGNGMRIAIIDSPSVQENQLNKYQVPLSNRISAINAASKKLLEYLGVWQTIIQNGVTCCPNIEFWQQNSIDYIYLDTKKYYLDNFIYIIENSIIHGSLWLQAKLSSDIVFLTKNTLKNVVLNEDKALIIFDNKQMLITKLVVGADGPKSWLRKKTGIPLIFWNYEYTALVATIKIKIPHMYTIKQYTNKDSILHFIPLYDPYFCLIIWYLPTVQAYKYLDLDCDVFEKKISIALDLHFGYCKLIHECQIFTLIGQYARNFVSQRIVLIGDAAHTVHPLVGQEINLGLMDVAELIRQIKSLNSNDKDFGQYFYLQKYECKRKYKTILTLLSIYELQQFFYSNNLIKKIIYDIGLLLINLIPGIKLNVINAILGLHDMPKWLKKIASNHLKN